MTRPEEDEAQRAVERRQGLPVTRKHADPSTKAGAAATVTRDGKVVKTTVYTPKTRLGRRGPYAQATVTVDPTKPAVKGAGAIIHGPGGTTVEGKVTKGENEMAGADEKRADAMLTIPLEKPATTATKESAATPPAPTKSWHTPQDRQDAEDARAYTEKRIEQILPRGPRTPPIGEPPRREPTADSVKLTPPQLSQFQKSEVRLVPRLEQPNVVPPSSPEATPAPGQPGTPGTSPQTPQVGTGTAPVAKGSTAKDAVGTSKAAKGEGAKAQPVSPGQPAPKVSPTQPRQPTQTDVKKRALTGAVRPVKKAAPVQVQPRTTPGQRRR